MSKERIYILGGGTVFNVRPHLALCAPAFGTVAVQIQDALLMKGVEHKYQLTLGLTRMAMGISDFLTAPNENIQNIGNTNEEVSRYIDQIIADPYTKMIFLSTAFCDFEGSVIEGNVTTESGLDQPRLKTSNGSAILHLTPADKIIGKIRKKRKDIFLVGFKTTAGASEQEQYEAGLTLLKKNSCNLVVANDLHTKLNMVVAPELARYGVTTDRTDAIRELVDIALQRCTNVFTPTTIENNSTRFPKLVPFVEGPETLQKVLLKCIEAGAYKPFNDITVGHFGYRTDLGKDTTVLVSSRRKQNFNRPECRDMVVVEFDDVNNRQTAFGAKPSAGARSQYLVLSKFKEYDCIIHFHCPMKAGSKVPVRSQREFECGSFQCGQNTADGMVDIKGEEVAAVMLDKHGPNVVFSRNADPERVWKFISENFDLSKSSR